MQKKYRGVARCATFWLLSAGLSLAHAQTATVAGTTPGQFSVNESGAATYRIPLQVPPGVAGMEPKLELSYNSQGGNGLLGMGWSLGGLSAITRCARTLAQDNVRGGVNFDMNDRYCMDGQRLILVSGAYGAAGSEYRTELDSFSKIVAAGTAGNGVASFTVQTKAGLTMEYGNTADSRIEAQGKTTVRAWAINRIGDVKTNFMTFSYTEDNANGSYYPSRIDYTGNSAAGLAPTNSVQFAYQVRPDATPKYMSGSLIKSMERLAVVSSYVGAAPLRRYQLEYLASVGSSSSSISNIRECEELDRCLPGTGFQHAAAITPAFQAVQSGLAVAGAWVDYKVQLADLNGDGIPDLVGYIANAYGWTAHTALGKGDGTFQAAQVGLAVAGAWVDYTPQLADVNGDGIPDLVAYVANASDWNTYTALGKGDGTFHAAQPGLIMAGGWVGYKLQLADLNGDGFADLVGYVANASGWNTYTALGKGDGTFQAAQLGLAVAGGWVDYKMQLADLNGDGFADLVGYVANASGWNTYTALGKGDGTFQAVQPGLIVTGGWVDYTPQLADVNGDGVPDLVAYVANASGWNTYTALGKGDGTFQPAQLGLAVAGAWVDYRLQLADLNGDGFADLVGYVANTSGWNTYIALGKGDGTFQAMQLGLAVVGAWGDYALQLADLNGDGIPDLVGYIANAYGWNTHTALGSGNATWSYPTAVAKGDYSNWSVSYTSLVRSSSYTKDTGSDTSTYPKLDLQYPQYVVGTVASSNGVGGTTTTQYSYGGLKAELGTGRSMLGFRWMKSKNLTNNIESYTEFNQNWPFTGSVFKSETRLAGSGSAGVLKRTTNTYAQGTGSATGSTFVYPSQSVEESWDLSGAAYPTVTSAYQYGQSPQYGDPTQISVINSAGAGKTTVNEYWPVNTGSGNWILGRLKKATVTSVTP